MLREYIFRLRHLIHGSFFFVKNSFVYNCSTKYYQSRQVLHQDYIFEKARLEMKAREGAHGGCAFLSGLRHAQGVLGRCNGPWVCVG